MATFSGHYGTPRIIADDDTLYMYDGPVIHGMTGVITDFTFDLIGLSHGYADDLVMQLSVQGPLGYVSTQFMDDHGGSYSLDDVDLHFVTGAPTLPDEAKISDGSYSSTLFDVLRNNIVSNPAKFTAAICDLRITDDDGGAAGSIDDWRVTFTTDNSLARIVGGDLSQTLTVTSTGAGTGSYHYKGNGIFESDQPTEFTGLTALKFNAGAGGDIFVGGDLQDTVYGEDGADKLSGGGGNDILNGGPGGDTMDGGAGDDILYVDGSADVASDSGGGNDTVYASGNATVGLGINRLILLEGSAALNGAGGADANFILGNSATNTLDGMGGNDTLDGGSGNDVLRGGTGNDTYLLGTSATSADAVIDAGGVADTIVSGITRSLASYGKIEKLTLTGVGAFMATGNGLANVLTGNLGANRLLGMAGNDTLVGNAGADRLTGGLGKDKMTGGIARDIFDFDTVLEIGKGSRRDVITDFARGLDDIDLSTIDANGAARGNAAFKFLAAKGAAFTGVAGELHWYQQNLAGRARDKTIVEGDVNGDGRYDFQIELTGLKVLTKTDFVL